MTAPNRETDCQRTAGPAIVAAVRDGAATISADGGRRLRSPTKWAATSVRLAGRPTGLVSDEAMATDEEPAANPDGRRGSGGYSCNGSSLGLLMTLFLYCYRAHTYAPNYIAASARSVRTAWATRRHVHARAHTQTAQSPNRPAMQPSNEKSASDDNSRTSLLLPLPPPVPRQCYGKGSSNCNRQNISYNNNNNNGK